MSRMGYVIVAIFILIGPTPLIIGAVATWRAWSDHQSEANARAGWLETTAQITACGAYNPHKGPTQWPYTFESEWKDAKGEVHRGKQSGSSCIVGRKHTIQYNPENPKQYAAPMGVFKPVPLILCLLGAAFIGIAIKEWRKVKAA